MRRTLLLVVSVLFAVSTMAQYRANVPVELKKISAKKPFKAVDNGLNSNQALPIPMLTPSKTVNVTYAEIGQTVYDLQSNSSVDHRMHLWPDGTIGTTYTLGLQSTAYPDRGTGYQYFDGTTWIDPFPTTRIETSRTGWGSYSNLGLTGDGEVVVAHNGTTMIINTRPAKGTGAWTQSTYPAANGADPTWPRICTNGNSIHVLSASNTAWNGQTFPTWYSRSQDGGATWDITNITLPGLTPADGYVEGFGGDVYDWAEPKNNTLAFLIGDNWTDLIMMKSTDNGDTWTKTVIFQHPYPAFNEATDLIGDGVVSVDTPYVADGAHAIVLDANGNAHVAFGLMRVANSDTTDGGTEYYPFTDGIAFWNEGEPTLTDLDADVLDAAGKLVAWTVDRSGDGTLFENFVNGTTDVPAYYLSLSSMPQLAIDDNNNIFLVYKGVCEDMLSTGNQYYSHIWGTSTPDFGGTWTPIEEITGGPDWDGGELVFPCMSQTTDNNLHLTAQYDGEPGLAIRGDQDAPGVNSIMYFTLAKSDLTIVKQQNLTNNVSLYPNPVANYMDVTLPVNKLTNVTMNIFNTVGALVDSKELVFSKNESVRVNISDLNKGMYVVKFETAEGTYTKKIVK